MSTQKTSLVRDSARSTLSVEARVELRKQLVALCREAMTLVEISPITGYARAYCPRLTKEFDAPPRAAAKLTGGGRAEGTGRKLTSK